MYSDADQAVAYLTSEKSSLRAIVLSQLTSNEIDQLKNTKIGIRHVALIGNNLDQYMQTVSATIDTCGRVHHTYYNVKNNLF